MQVRVEVPTVLIQHPTRCTRFLVPGDRLADFAWEDDPSNGTANMVTFAIPDELGLCTEMPVNGSDPDAAAYAIRDSARGATYRLSAEQLAEFEVDDADVAYDIAFIVPVGLDLIEEMPALMRGLLQSGTDGDIER